MAGNGRGRGSVPKDKKKDKTKDKAPKGGKAPALGHNITDEVIDHHLKLIQPAAAELDKRREEMASANGSYRALLKSAKKDGGEALVRGIEQALKKKKGDFSEIRLNCEVERRVLKRLIPSLATIYAEQTDLFDGGAKAAHVNDSEDVAFQEGIQASAKGFGAAENPHDDGSPEYLRWMAGWRSDQDEKLGKFKTGGGQGALGKGALGESRTVY